MPRLIVFCLLVAVAALAVGLGVSVWRAPARRRVGHGDDVARCSASPLSTPVRGRSRAAELWNLIRGAAAIAPPPRADLGRRYLELLVRESRAARLPRAAADRARHGRAPRRGVRAARRRPSPAVLRPRGGRRRPRRPKRSISPGVGRDHVIDALAAQPGDAGRDRSAPAAVPRRRPVARRDAPDVRSSRRAGAAARRSGGRRRRAGDRAVGRAAAGAAARAQLGAAATCAAARRSSSPSFEAADLRDALERSAGRFAGCYVDPARAQPARAARFRRRLRRAVRSALQPRRAASTAATRTRTTSSSSRSSPPAASASSRSNRDW